MIKIGDIKGGFTVIELKGKRVICQCECGSLVSKSMFDWSKNPQKGCMKCKVKHTPLTEEQSQLAANYYLWAMKRIKYLQLRYPYLSMEIESAAMLGLIYAAEKYDKEKTFNHNLFNKFADYAIKRQLSVLWRRSRETTIDSFPFDSVEAKEERVLPRIDWESISDREREVLILYYLDRKTNSEIAKKINCTTNYINVIKRKALKRLKERMMNA